MSGRVGECGHCERRVYIYEAMFHPICSVCRNNPDLHAVECTYPYCLCNDWVNATLVRQQRLIETRHEELQAERIRRRNQYMDEEVEPVIVTDLTGVDDPEATESERDDDGDFDASDQETSSDDSADPEWQEAANGRQPQSPPSPVEPEYINERTHMRLRSHRNGQEHIMWVRRPSRAAIERAFDEAEEVARSLFTDEQAEEMARILEENGVAPADVPEVMIAARADVVESIERQRQERSQQYELEDEEADAGRFAQRRRIQSPSE